MDRVEFMRQLKELLQDITPAEREEALRYYNNYFDDAGIENEQQVIRELGSPARVSENIKSGLSESGLVEIGGGFSQKAEQPSWREADRQSGQKAEQSAAKKAPMPAWAIVLIVFGCILLSPVIFGVLGVLFAAIVTWFALIFACGVAALSLFAVLIFLVVLACMCLMEPMVSLALLGGGLFCGGIAILFFMLTVAMAGVVTPAVFRGIAWLFHPHRRAVA